MNPQKPTPPFPVSNTHLILHSQTPSGYDGVPIVRNDNTQTDSNKWSEYVEFSTVWIAISMV